MKPDTLKLTRAESARLISVIYQVQPYRVPLLRAMGDGLLGICEIPRGVSYPRKTLEGRKQPLVCIISDDDYQSTGPAGFPAARKLRSWARRAVVHAAAGETFHYAAIVAMALLFGRVLVVETDTAHASLWQHYLGNGKRLGLLCILTDGVHPVLPPKQN